MEKVASGNNLLNPLNILNMANIGFGDTVADLGTGAQGHFTMQAAKIVGDRGRVYGVDILKSVLQNIEARAKEAGLHNITTVWSNLEVVGAAKQIADHTVDTAFLINVLFQTKEHRDNIFQEARRILKKGGRLVVIDWKKKGSAVGPAKKFRISNDEIKNILIANQFKIQKEFEAGEYHWGIIATT